MLDVDAIEVNSLLRMVESYRLNASEIALIDKTGVPADTVQARYEIALTILKKRAKSNFNLNGAITSLIEYAQSVGVVLPETEEIIPSVNVMFIGGSL